MIYLFIKINIWYIQLIFSKENNSETNLIGMHVLKNFAEMAKGI